jgi:hypothetical protein
MATNEVSTHPFPAQARVAQALPLVDRVISIVDRSPLTTCDWTDMFCDCREVGTIHCLKTEEDLCFRHFVMRLAETPSPAFAPDLKKPGASVGLDGQARPGFGD